MATDAGLGQPCFDGSPVSADACPSEPPPSQQKEQKKQAKKRQQRRTSSKQQDPISSLISRLPWKLKRRHKRQLAVAAELLIGTAMSGLMAWAVVLLLQRVMQVCVACVCWLFGASLSSSDEPWWLTYEWRSLIGAQITPWMPPYLIIFPGAERSMVLTRDFVLLCFVLSCLLAAGEEKRWPLGRYPTHQCAGDAGESSRGEE